MGDNRCKLSPCSFGTAIGLTTALYVFVLGIVAMYFGYGMAAVNAIGTFYVGYQATWIGSIIGAVWGFFDGFIFGVLMAWIYNCCLCCCKKSGSC